jgi:hypothetical protein
MSEIPQITMYMTDDGPVKVDDLTREQAIAAVKELGRELRSMHEARASWRRLDYGDSPGMQQRLTANQQELQRAA